MCSMVRARAACRAQPSACGPRSPISGRGAWRSARLARSMKACSLVADACTVALPEIYTYVYY